MALPNEMPSLEMSKFCLQLLGIERWGETDTGRCVHTFFTCNGYS